MTVSIQFDADTMMYELYVSDGRMRAMPAGARLFKGGEIPHIQFAHDDASAAAQDAQKLEQYLNAPRKGPTAKELRKTNL